MKTSMGFNYKYDSTPSQRLAWIAAAGFDGIHLHAHYAPAAYIDVVRQTTLTIDSLHLSYKTIVSGRSVDSRRVNVLWLDDDRADDYVAELLREVAFADQHGIPTVVMHITGGDAPPPMSEHGVRNIGRVLAVCEKYGINLCLENLRRLDYLDYVFERLGSDRLRFCFDTGHANCMTKNINAFPWDRYASRLHYLHIHDNDGTADQHGLPFSGAIDWLQVMRMIGRVNPHLALTLEVRSSAEVRQTCSEPEYLAACFRSAVRLRALVEVSQR